MELDSHSRSHSHSMMTTPATRRADDFTQKVEVETPELVVLSYTIAGIGSRVYAGFMDLLVTAGLLIAIGLASAMLRSRLGVPLGITTMWATVILALVSFGILWGYYVICEWAFDGQTFGKWRLGLRVVRDGGYSIGFTASAVRNLVRIVDMQPGLFYLIGIGSAVLSKTGKRLGDIAAGTIVIQERLVETPAGERRRPARATDMAV